jgi:hypothetical protein
MEKGCAVRSFVVVFQLIIVAFTALPTNGRAATAMVTITATVLRNLSVKATSGLVFGAIDTSANAGAIVVRDDGSRVATGGAQLDQGAVAGPAVLVIHGQPHTSFSLSMPVAARIYAGPGASMVVDHFRQSTEKEVSLDGHGLRTIRIGATLHVRANQPLGTYAGAMQVTVNYN